MDRAANRASYAVGSASGMFQFQVEAAASTEGLSPLHDNGALSSASLTEKRPFHSVGP
jgi:hypothetical protein